MLHYLLPLYPHFPTGTITVTFYLTSGVKVYRLIKQVAITVEQCYNEDDSPQEHIRLSMGKSSVSLRGEADGGCTAGATGAAEAYSQNVVFVSAAALHMLKPTRLHVYSFKSRS